MQESIKSDIITVTGDFTDDGSKTDFKKAKDFLNSIKSTACIPDSNIFIVPGNHDVVLKESTPKKRMSNYSNFYKQYFRIKSSYCCIDNAVNVKTVKEKSLIIVELNSCCDISSTSNIGTINQSMFDKLEIELDKKKEALGSKYNKYIKIALLHHHAILLPLFLEKMNKEIIDDTILKSETLLDTLVRYGFHLILHGHKHYPVQYTHDPNSAWSLKETNTPILIVAGGSCGVKNPEHEGDKNSCNTYNIIDIEQTDENSITIEIKTKGLTTEKDGKTIPNKKLWHWEDRKYRWFQLQFNKLDNEEWGWRVETSTQDYTITVNKIRTVKRILYNCSLPDRDFCQIYLENKYEDFCNDKKMLLELKSEYIENEIQKLKLNKQVKTEEIIAEDLKNYIVPALKKYDEATANQLINHLIMKI